MCGENTTEVRPTSAISHSKIIFDRRGAERIDKRKLLEIARKNAISLLQQGAIPASVITSSTKSTSIKSGGKTVDELTGSNLHSASSYGLRNELLS